MANVTQLRSRRPRVLEFFAGIGLARLGLEDAGFDVVWANDFDAKKQQMYAAVFGDQGASHFEFGDIRDVAGKSLPKSCDVAWASSPCTDLSVAGGREGLAGRQSGVFWDFTRVLDELGPDRPRCVVLENVVGLATSRGGEDLSCAMGEFNRLGYSVDVLHIDARRFVAQSRPRIFLIGVLGPVAGRPCDSHALRPDWLSWIHSDQSLRTHRLALPAAPESLETGFGELVEKMSAKDERWWEADRQTKFIGSLSPTQYDRVMALVRSRGVKYRTAYRRTRKGQPVWEVRPDDIAGCLRTARGGSSKQAVVKLGNGKLSVRWMTPLEYARLMGVEDYAVDSFSANQVLFGFGDAVAVPVVKWLAENYLAPVVAGHAASRSDVEVERCG